MIIRLFIIVVVSLVSWASFAQTAVTESGIVIPAQLGSYTNVGCPTAVDIQTYCFIPYDTLNPLPVTGALSIAGTTSNASSGVATSSTNLPTVAYVYGFNGTTWDQLQVDGSKNLKVTSAGTTSNAGSGVATSSVNSPVVNYNYGFNGTTWDQLQVDASKNLKVLGIGSISNAGSGVATASTNIPTIAYMYGFNGTTWDQLQVDGSKNLKVTGTVTVSTPAVGITPTDHTITSASGASQQIMALNASRHSLTIENTGNANCGVNPTGGTAAIGGAGTITLAPLGAYTPRVPTLTAVTVICTAGQPIYGDDN